MNYKEISSANELASIIPQLEQRRSIVLELIANGRDPFHCQIEMILLAVAEQSYLLHPTDDIITLLRPLLIAERPTKVLHDAKLAYKLLSHQFGIRMRGIFDTMLASHLITGDSRLDAHSFANTVRHFLNIVIDKDDNHSSLNAQIGNDSLVSRARDAALLLRLYQVQREQLKELNLIHIAKLEFDTVSAIAAMELAGIKLEVDRWQSLVKTIEHKHSSLSIELKKELQSSSPQLSLFEESSTINLDSPQQVMEALRNLGIPITRTRAGYLQQYADEYPIIDKFLEYRGLQKLLTSYGNNMLKFINVQTGRIHAEFHQIGTPTGRLACHNPNLQQIPKSVDYRSCFVAPEGRKFIVADYSQIELRILADIANDNVLIEAFRSGKDLHRITASQMFNIPMDSVTTYYREAAKRLNYGIVYGMGAKGLARLIESSLVEAEDLIKKYFDTYRGVAQWLRRAGQQSIEAGTIRTKLGRRVEFRFDKSNAEEVSAITRYGKNFPIQGTSAEITKRAMVLLNDLLINSNSKLVNSIHDELIVEVDNNEADRIANIVRELMIRAGNEIIPAVAVEVDLKVNQCWIK